MSDSGDPVPRPVAERCRHGLIAAACFNCAPKPRRPSVPVQREDGGQARSSGAAPAVEAGVFVLRVARGRKHCGIERIDERVTFVHFDGMPYLWAIEEVPRRAPNLKTIQVIPSMYPRIHSGHELCKARGVEIVRGHHRPECAWTEHRIVAPQYADQRRFMPGMKGEQRAQFDELVALGSTPRSSRSATSAWTARSTSRSASSRASTATRNRRTM